MTQSQLVKPYKSYVEAWTTFRANSDEIKVIAEWLLLQKAWPNKGDFCVTDLGCGDGKVAAEVIRLAAGRGCHTKSITLVDPDRCFLRAAYEHVGDVVRIISPNGQNHCKIKQVLRGACDAPLKCFGADVLLLSHVVYLMPTRDFAKLLDLIRPGVPLYVILDHTSSVFSQLWRETAKKYLHRVERAHNIISMLPKEKYRVTKSKPGELVSRLKKSALTHHLTGQKLVSMLCYNDKKDIGKDERFKRFFWKIVGKEANGYVKCQSVGYEIVREA